MKKKPAPASESQNSEEKKDLLFSPPAARLNSVPGNEFAKQGIAVMKKKPAPASEIPKAAAKTERPGAGRTAKRADAPAPPVPEKPKTARAPRKPLLDVAVETVKKMLKPNPAAQPAPVPEEPKHAATGALLHHTPQKHEANEDKDPEHNRFNGRIHQDSSFPAGENPLEGV